MSPSPIRVGERVIAASGKNGPVLAIAEDHVEPVGPGWGRVEHRPQTERDKRAGRATETQHPTDAAAQFLSA